MKGVRQRSPEERTELGGRVGLPGADLRELKLHEVALSYFFQVMKQCLCLRPKRLLQALGVTRWSVVA